MGTGYGDNSGFFNFDGNTVHISSHGAGPFMFRIDGKRVFFEDSDMFGPAVLSKRTWNPADRQPGSRNRFWDAYEMWRKAGRPLRGQGRVKVAVWSEPRAGEYWKDENGISHTIRDPDVERLGYRCVDKPEGGAG